MRPGRSRRVQAQRKFAQGAYVPPIAAPAAASSADRRDPAVDNRNVIINRTSATNLLDVVSFQGVHPHLQPVVLLERLRGNNIGQDSSHSRDRGNERQRQNANVPNRNIPKKRTQSKITKQYKRTHGMTLRSQQPRKPLEIIIRRSSRKRIPTKRRCYSPPEKPSKRNRRKLGAIDIDYCIESSECSLDDNRPLAFFLNSSTPKRPLPLLLPSCAPPLPSSAPPLPSSAPPLPSSASSLPSAAPPLPSAAPPLPSAAPLLPSSAPPLPPSKPPLPLSMVPLPPLPPSQPPLPPSLPPLPSYAPPLPSYAPPLPSYAPPLPSYAPPLPSYAPPLPSYAPPLLWSAPSLPSSAPPLPSCAPPLPSCAPPLPSCAPPLPSCAPPLPSRAPPLPSCAPPLPSCAPPLAVLPSLLLSVPKTPSPTPLSVLSTPPLPTSPKVESHEDSLTVPPAVLQVPIVKPRDPSPEPVAGPSGLQRPVDSHLDPYVMVPTQAHTLSSASSVVSGRSSYYSEHNIHRWMNDSLTPESQRKFEPDEFDEMIMLEEGLPVNTAGVTIEPCPANQWVSVRDVINAPKHELDSRCKVCRSCERISKLIKLSALLKKQVKIDVTGDITRSSTLPPMSDTDDNDAMVSSDGNIYMELLPKQPGMMIKLKKHIVLGKELFSACLIPRSDARNAKELMLQEQESYLDQLDDTLKLSALPRRRRRVTIDTYRSDESDIIILDPVKQAKCREQQARRAIKSIKMQEAKARLRAATDTAALIKAEQDAELAALERIKVEEQVRAEFEGPRVPEEEIVEVELEVEPELVAEACLMAEVDEQARALENEADAKGDNAAGSDNSSDGNPDDSDQNEAEGAKLVDAPVFRPTLEEFADPMKYFESIWQSVRRYGICRIVPPDGWDPPAKIPDDMRFESTNQYISRLFSRWGPAARELCAIKLCLKQQNVNFTRLPLVDGVEINLPKLYHLVQCHGGLENVINKKRWGKVAEEMKFNRTHAIEKKLDQIYVKYLLPYDTLAHQERQEIMRKVEKAWNRKNQKLLDRALNPFHRQKRMVGESESSDDETEDEETAIALAEAEDCIVPGLCTNLAKFKKVAANAYEYHFGFRSATEPSIDEIEDQYWRYVLLGTEHLCVYSASIDTGDEGYGFTKNKNEPYGRHPWNLKMLSANPRNMLRSLGRRMGLTVPTIHIGMIFTTSCWHKDPHGLPWLEYMHCGRNKIWYGIPESQTDNFRKAAETLCPTSCQNKMMWLPSDIAMIPPHILRDHNVTITRAVQNAGEFILVFPKAYSCAISVGYTESESVYFAPPSWLEELPQLFKDARESCEPTMFSLEQLLISMAQDLRTDQPTLRTIRPTLDKLLREEISNRQKLYVKKAKFIHEQMNQQSNRRQTGAWNVRDSDECEYCKSTLYLSKVQGITGSRGALCLEHAIKLLNSDKYKNIDIGTVEVHVYVSLKDINNISEGMERRLNAPDS